MIIILSQEWWTNLREIERISVFKRNKMYKFIILNIFTIFSKKKKTSSFFTNLNSII